MLKELLKEFNFTDSKIEKLNKLREICLEYNKHTNLTSIEDEEQFNIKHILDSLSILRYYELNNMKILDVGSGGGFPGLVLSIVLEDSEVTMIDSNNKKVEYIEFAIKELGLTNSKAVHNRIEDAGMHEGYDVVVSRAVASLNILLEITADPIKVGGKSIFYKGSNIESEITNNWEQVNKKLGLELNTIDKFSLIDENDRCFLSFNKVKSTNGDYPRNYSQIKKKPIF